MILQSEVNLRPLYLQGIRCPSSFFPHRRCRNDLSSPLYCKICQFLRISEIFEVISLKGNAELSITSDPDSLAINPGTSRAQRYLPKDIEALSSCLRVIMRRTDYPEVGKKPYAKLWKCRSATMHAHVRSRKQGMDVNHL